MQVSQSEIAAIRQHAAEFPTQEVCGFLLDSGQVLRAHNVHQCPETDFAIWDGQFIAANDRGAIAAIYHSHVNSNDAFSVPDIKACRQVQIPYILCHTPTLRIRVYDPNEIQPYEGREWGWCWNNCFTLFQDYYKRELGVMLPDFYSPYDRSWLREDMGYTRHLPLNGFRRLELNEVIATHDVALMTLGLRYPNHVGVIVDAVQNKILHHCADQPSEITVYAPGNDYWKSTHSIWRLA